MLHWAKENSLKAALGGAGVLYVGSKVKEYLTPRESIDGKIVLITGGASGFGKELAIQMKQKGSIVIVWDVNKDDIENMKRQGFDTEFVDVTQKSIVDEQIKHILNKYQRIDILIHNAGILNFSAIKHCFFLCFLLCVFVRTVFAQNRNKKKFKHTHTHTHTRTQK